MNIRETLINLLLPKDVNRFELIDRNGRTYMDLVVTKQPVISLQDNNKTIKIFK